MSEPPAAAAGLPVGQFTFALDGPGADVDINEIVTLRMRISGSGNTKAILPPALPGGDMAMVYPAKITQETAYSPAALTGTLNAEIPVSFKRRASSPSRPWSSATSTRPGAPWSACAAPPSACGSAARSCPPAWRAPCPAAPSCRRGRISTSSRAARSPGRSRPIHRQAWFPLLLAALFAANLLVLLKRSAWDRGIAASPGMRNRRILARALKRLDATRHAGEIAPAMESFFCEKSGLGLAEVNDRRIAEVLAAKGVTPAGIEAFLFIKGQSELARFSPLKKSALELKKDLQVLRGLFCEIDRKMK